MSGFLCRLFLSGSVYSTLCSAEIICVPIAVSLGIDTMAAGTEQSWDSAAATSPLNYAAGTPTNLRPARR